MLSLFSVLAALLLNTLLCHALSLVLSLVSVSRGTAGGAVILVLLFNVFINSLSWERILPISFLTVFPVLEMAVQAGPDPQVFMRRGGQLLLPTFYGFPLGVDVQTLLYQGPVLLFLWLGAVRKMRKEAAPMYSKPLAVAFLTVIAGLTMGGLWDVAHRARVAPQEAITPVVILLYILSLSALLLASPTTPKASEVASGLRRAARLGLNRLSFWNDSSPNYVVLGSFCCVIFVSAVLTMSMTGAPLSSQFWLPSLVAVLTVTHAGLARQYLALASGGLPQLLSRLSCLIIWVLPLLIGGGFCGARIGEEITAAVVGISPFAGIFVCASPPAMGRIAVFGTIGIAQLTALGSAVIFALVFAVMTYRVQTRINKWFVTRA